MAEKQNGQELRLKTQHELLEGLKADGFNYFLLDDDIYQYINGKLISVLYADQEKPILSVSLEDFPEQDAREYYLQFQGVTDDFVAFLVAEKGTMIFMDEQGVVTNVTTGKEFGNRPSQFQGVPNLIVEYLKPGYLGHMFHYEHDLTNYPSHLRRPEPNFRKVIHDGQFFYNGYEYAPVNKAYSFEVKMVTTVGKKPPYSDDDEEFRTYTTLTSNHFDTPERAIQQALKAARASFDISLNNPGVKESYNPIVLEYVQIYEVHTNRLALAQDLPYGYFKKLYLNLSSFMRHDDGVQSGQLYINGIDEGLKGLVEQTMEDNGFELHVYLKESFKPGAPDWNRIKYHFLTQLADTEQQKEEHLPVGYTDLKTTAYKDFFNHSADSFFTVPRPYGMEMYHAVEESKELFGDTENLPF